MMFERITGLFRSRQVLPPPVAMMPPAPATEPVGTPEPMRDDWTDAPLATATASIFERTRHYRPLIKTVVSVEKAVDLFITWANDQGVTGLFTKDEIDDLWLGAQVDLDIAEIEPVFIRAALDERGFKPGQVRLMSPQYAAVRARTGKVRATLFRIPTLQALATLSPPLTTSSPAVAASSPAKTASARQASGKRAASVKEREFTRKIAA